MEAQRQLKTSPQIRKLPYIHKSYRVSTRSLLLEQFFSLWAQKSTSSQWVPPCVLLALIQGCSVLCLNWILTSSSRKAGGKGNFWGYGAERDTGEKETRPRRQKEDRQRNFGGLEGCIWWVSGTDGLGMNRNTTTIRIRTGERERGFPFISNSLGNLKTTKDQRKCPSGIVLC